MTPEAEAAASAALSGTRPHSSHSPKSSGDKLAGIVSPVLRAAAREVADDLASEPAGVEGDPELPEKLLGLVRSIESDEPVPKWALDLSIGSAGLRRLLELLRAKVLRQWAATNPLPAPTEMLSVLSAFERTRAALEPGDQHSLSYFGGSGGTELVVEVAHNLRSPLTSILFLSETLLRGHSGPVSDVQHRQLGLIYSATLGLESTVSDVIELAHGGHLLMENHPSAFSVSDLLESICDIVKPMAEQKGLLLRTVPISADRRLGYPTALSRVLLNLATNALKFTERGFVEIATRAISPSRVEFSVQDTGDGFEAGSRHELFQPFRGASSTGKHAFSATGLGLAICRRLAGAMDSELHYESARGQGTRFFFEVELPLETSG